MSDHKPDRIVHLAAQAGVRHSLDAPRDYIDANIRGRVLGGLTTVYFLGRFFSPILAQPFIDNFGMQEVFKFTGVLLLVITISVIPICKLKKL